jgi:uncharacterized membrane protein YciS (DUF1049 family)
MKTTAHAISFLIMLIAVFALGFMVGIMECSLHYEKKAVSMGYGEKYINHDGEIRFRWIEPERRAQTAPASAAPGRIDKEKPQ